MLLVILNNLDIIIIIIINSKFAETLCYKTRMYRVAVTLTVIFLTGGQCSDLTAVTQAVFGEDALSKELIPAAFGDFNSDKLTDLIVFDSKGRTVAVLLASEQSVVPTDSSPMFSNDRKSLNCSCPDDGEELDFELFYLYLTIPSYRRQVCECGAR